MPELILMPELGPPPPATPAILKMRLPDRAAAMAKTVEYLAKKGMTVETSTAADRETASALVLCYAADPGATDHTATTRRMDKMTPASLRHIDAMLRNFGAEVATDAAQIRHYVTNKLLEESDNPDPRIRMRALELLGKVSDVGLFAERREVTITHQTTEDLRESLRTKLEKLTAPDVIDVTPVEVDLGDLLLTLDDG
jgi:hypothetical protein